MSGRPTLAATPSIVRARELAMEQKVLDPWRTDALFAGLRKSARMFVPGEGDITAAIAVVGEGPGETEDRCGEPFVGPAGKLLEEFLAEAGCQREDVWLTNLMKYRCTDTSGNDRRPYGPECIRARKYLARELSVVKPRVVVLCGRSAYQALKPGGSVVKDRGTEFRLQSDRTYLPVLHPAAVLRGPAEWEFLTRGDWRKIPELLLV